MLTFLLNPIKNYYRQKLNPTPQVLEILSKKQKDDYEDNPDKKYYSKGTTLSVEELKPKKFGELNKDKTFYVIKRTPGTGLFSNVVFVLNHLAEAKKLNYIPIIDMQNYLTIYNDLNKIHKTNNAWEYYFKQTSKFTLEEIYKSHNVIITENKFYNNFKYDMENQYFNDFTSVQKLVKDHFLKICNKIKKKHFNQKILGVHFRGTSYKQSTGHPLPATKIQMKNLVKKIMERDNINKILLVTEEKNYLEFFLKEFKDKVIYLKSAYRSDKNDAFKTYPRNNHRYKLGREALIETILLSECDSFIYLTSNVSGAVMAFNLNSNQKRFRIDNGINSKKVLHSLYKWYIKKILPEYMGGFKKNLY